MSARDISEGLPIRGEPLLPCAECGKMVYFALDEQDEPSGLIHEEPMCLVFEHLEPNAFLSWMNDQYETKQEPDA
jgi:hypothetical protein